MKNLMMAIVFSLTLGIAQASAVAAEFGETDRTIPVGKAFKIEGRAEFEYRNGHYPSDQEILRTMRNAKKNANQLAKRNCNRLHARRISEFNVRPGYGVWRAIAWYECVSVRR